MSDTLEVLERPSAGKRNNQRLRAEGKLPAVLYGHGEGSVNLAVSVDQLKGVLRHGGKVVDLKGAASGQALLQDMQWDTFGTRLLHIDLMRIKAGEVLHIEVPLETKGESQGERDGGMVELMAHTIEIETKPASVPDKLVIDISGLELNGALTAGDIQDLPDGVKIITEASQAVVHCIPKPLEDEEPVASEAGEPEVINAKPDAEEEG